MGWGRVAVAGLASVLLLGCAAVEQPGADPSPGAVETPRPTDALEPVPSLSSPAQAPDPTVPATPAGRPAPGVDAPRWSPKVGATFHIQYTGKVDLTHPVDVYNLDWEQTTAEEVRFLAGRGVPAVCYVNAGAYEDFRPDRAKFPAAVLGTELAGWPGERWLDIRQLEVLLPIMAARMDVCQSKGFVAIDPDNTDGWIQQSGFPLSAQDQLTYHRALADAAHQRGLAIGLKNDVEQLDKLAAVVDFAVNEECIAYRECHRYAGFLAGGKAVFNIEYQGKPEKVCPGRPAGMVTVIATRRLNGRLTACP